MTLKSTGKATLAILALVVTTVAAAQTDGADEAVRSRRTWSFDGTLEEAHGACPFRLNVPNETPRFAADGARRVLAPAGGTYTANADPLFDLEPGLRFACRVKLDRLHPDTGWTTLLARGTGAHPGDFFLRVDRPDEREHLSFFVNLDGAPEPRVSSRRPLCTNTWYDIAAGWDGSNVWLTVNGETTRTPRRGPSAGCLAPLKVGPLFGSFADLSITGIPPGPATDVSAAPGLSLACSVSFDELPSGETAILYKPNEYLLRYDTPKNGTPGRGSFGFWVFLNGGWEPRCAVNCPIEPHRTYHLFAAWDGLCTHLGVDGLFERQLRSGTPHPSRAPVATGPLKGRVSNIAVRTRRTAEPHLSRRPRTRELMPHIGEPFTLSALLGNHGACAATNLTLTVTAPAGVTVTPATRTFATVPSGSETPLDWRVAPGTNDTVTLVFALAFDGHRVSRCHKRIVLMPRADPPTLARSWLPPQRPTRTFYVDALDGDDARDGCSPATAWRSFRPVRGRILGPGERLLLRRGSVFNEELVLTARAAPDNWAEIGAYGTGARPQIRRSRHLDDRCAHIVSPAFLVVRDLVVCNAGKGLDIACVDAPCGGLLVERCLAHHIEGHYRFNSHGIPEWRDCRGAPGPGSPGGISLVGDAARDIVLRDCEMYACSSGFRVTGANVVITRCFCHDSFRANTSPHPFFTSTAHAWLVDSIFDAAGWSASAGTMGIMLGGNDGLVIRGCHFLNQPDSGSGDEGGIDFEADGENCLIDACTFRNNAGAAIEVLGLRTPQARNTHIRGCRFIRNNYRHVLGPSEIFIWGGTTDPAIVCSSGLIEGNGAVLAPGVAFYTNQAVRTRADWTLRDNTVYASPEALDRALPLNDPPAVEAGPEIWTDSPVVALAASCTDDARTPSPVSLSWEQLEGAPGLRFADPSSPTTTVTCPGPGDYRLLLHADDGQYLRSSRTALHVLPRGTRTKRAWTFAKDLDAEGWTTNALGTVREDFKGITPTWNTFAKPVAIVGGDTFTFAVRDAPSAHLRSADNLGIALEPGDALRLRVQNHTSSTCFGIVLTLADGTTHTCRVPVIAHDNDDTLYTVPLATRGTLRQIRLDLSANGRPITGTIRLDYLWLGTFKNQP